MSSYLAGLFKPVLAPKQLPAVGAGSCGPRGHGTAELKVDGSQDHGYQISGVVESRAGGRLLLHDQLTTRSAAVGGCQNA